MQLKPAQEAQLKNNFKYFFSEIANSGGAIPFDHFMDRALYAPGIGYYVNGTKKFGSDGDFVTAPEISSFFSKCLANQCSQILTFLKSGEILEFGAGSGLMTVDILKRLKELNCLPKRYLILELSADLIERQRQKVEREIPDLKYLVTWIEKLPEKNWQGVILANEVLDAMPVNIFCRKEETWKELYITEKSGELVEVWFKPRAHLQKKLKNLEEKVGYFSDGYRSEINIRLDGWMKALSNFLNQGVILLIDYGYSAKEYYHPDRSEGTLICHIQHKAHSNPLILPGLQDITANVNFSEVADSGLNAGFTLSGYTTQAHFLINTGIDEFMKNSNEDSAEYLLKKNQEIKQLILPTAMGERFKVIGFQKNIDEKLEGFESRDLSGYL